MILQTAPTGENMDLLFGIMIVASIFMFALVFYLVFVRPYEDEDSDEPDIIDSDEY